MKYFAPILLCVLLYGCDSSTPVASDDPPSPDPVAERTVTYKLVSSSVDTVNVGYVAPEVDERGEEYLGRTGLTYLGAKNEPWEVTLPHWNGIKGFDVYGIDGDGKPLHGHYTLEIWVDGVLADRKESVADARSWGVVTGVDRYKIQFFVEGTHDGRVYPFDQFMVDGERLGSPSMTFWATGYAVSWITEADVTSGELTIAWESLPDPLRVDLDVSQPDRFVEGELRLRANVVLASAYDELGGIPHPYSLTIK